MAAITGSAGNDLLFGTAGNDVIDGMGGIDTISAGGGDDVVRFTVAPALGNALQSMVDGGAGHDILDLTGLSGTLDLLISADGEIQFGQIGTPDNFFLFTEIGAAQGFEEVHLGPGGSNVEIELGAENQSMPILDWDIVGNIGNDTISDGRGNDSIAAGDGNDMVGFRGGDDRVTLGAGDDRYDISFLDGHSGQAVVDGGSGSDTLSWTIESIPQSVVIDLAAGTAQGWTASLALTSFENVSVGNFLGERLPVSIPGWHADLAGDGGANRLHANIVDDGTATISGRGGDDDIIALGSGTASVTAYGGAGNDRISGTQGGDWINGGGHAQGDPFSAVQIDDGADTLLGLGGNDHIFGNAQTAVQGGVDGGDLIDAGAGSDYVNGNAGDDTIQGGAGSDRLYGGAGDDVISGDDDTAILRGEAAPGNDHLNGNKGNDTLFGGFGNDDLHGGQGDDVLHGGEQGDVLSGDAGDDLLDGGGGADTLIGGSGADIFQFLQTAAGGLPFVPVDGAPIDEIIDFEHGVDHIQLPFHLAGVVLGGTATGLTEAVAEANVLLRDVGSADIAVAIEIGSDAYILYASGGTGNVDGAIRLNGVNAATTAPSDFL